jgi:hypothetical protein
VYLVRVNLADGATVTESKMMRDRLTKRLREVDVVIEGKVGSQRVVVSVECRDHKRVADVTWIDMMKSKHDRLDTHALLLASKRGFTQEARDVARKYGIGLFTLEDVETADIPAMLATHGSLWIKSATITPAKVSARVSKIEELESEIVVARPDNLLYLADGSELCPIKQMVDLLLQGEYVRNHLLTNGGEEHAWFELVWEPPADHEGKPLYMKKLGPDVLRPIECIRIAGPCKIELGRFGMRHGKLGEIHVAWGKTTLAGHDAFAVSTFDPSGTTKLSFYHSGSISGV